MDERNHFIVASSILSLVEKLKSKCYIISPLDCIFLQKIEQKILPLTYCIYFLLLYHKYFIISRHNRHRIRYSLLDSENKKYYQGSIFAEDSDFLVGHSESIISPSLSLAQYIQHRFR